MDTTHTNSSMRLQGKIDRKTYRTADLEAQYDDWGEMSRAEKLDATRSVEPVNSETVYNATTDRLHQYFVDNLDGGQTSSKDNIDAAWLALGDDSTTPSTSDTDLKNRLYEQPVTDTADNGKDLLTSTFLGSNDGNDNTYVELGLFSGDPNNLGDSDVFMLNRATFSSVTKDNTKTTTFDVTLTFSDA